MYVYSSKYSDFVRSVPIAVESSGAFGKDALEFFQDLGRRTRLQTKDVLSYHKLYQCHYSAFQHCINFRLLR